MRSAKRKAMIKRVAKSFSIAVKVAVIGFEKAFRENEDLDSILGYRDTLTGILNRKAFDRDRDRVRQGLALVMIDIDHLKDINDRKGHVFGDTVLRRLAAILETSVGPEGSAYRIGGDEFVMIVPKSRVHTICSTICCNLRKEDRFTISQGVILNLENRITDKIMNYADTVLYESKTKGRNRITTSIPALA
jgi:diguanylate cyclase (GGDEF)-like protein